jgi:hypothetical protein
MFPTWGDRYGSEHGWIYVAVPKPRIIGVSVPPCVKLGMTLRDSRARAREWSKVGFDTLVRWPMRHPNEELDVHDNPMLRPYRFEPTVREVYLAEPAVVELIRGLVVIADGQGVARYAKGESLDSVLYALDELEELSRWFGE